MPIDVGLFSIILIFTFLIIPGYLFRRFYYRGEFSKQLSSYTGHIPNLVNSLFAGILLTVFGVFFISFFSKNELDLATILSDFADNFVFNDSELKESSKYVFAQTARAIYDEYLIYLITLYILSAALGYISYKIVLVFYIDVLIKLLRFKNTWHYLFTGRLLNHPKFKNEQIVSNDNKNEDEEEESITNDLNKENELSTQVMYTYLDVLVDENSDGPRLYSGLYADYSLNPKDPSKLDELHLLKARRYNRDKDVVEIKEIPGDIFTISGKNILNINCNYYYYKKSEVIYNRFLPVVNLAQIFSLIIFGTITITLLSEINLINSEFLELSFEYSIWKKIGLIMLVNLILGILVPFKVDKDKQKIVFDGWPMLLMHLIIFLIIFTIIYFDWILSIL